MSFDATSNGRPRFLSPLGGLGTRAAASTLRPFSGAIEAALGAGLTLERRVVDRVLDSEEVERVVLATLDSARVQDTLLRALESPGATRLVDGFFASGLFDRFVDRLLSSDALWRLIDEIAQSPAVTAAISQQGLGFADEVGQDARARARRADDWLERAAHRLTRRSSLSPRPEASAGS